MSTASFTCTAGALIRGQIKRELTQGAWGMGLEIKVDESKTLFDSAYRFTVTGEEGKVRAFVRAAHVWFVQLKAEE